MKRIGIGIVALGLSLSALTMGSKAASAAEPCAPAAPSVTVQPAGYYSGGYYSPRAAARYREHLRWEREQARIRWQREHRYYRGW
ncbi:MAG TPA: hypothetical protein VH083_07235 [Myxococcales bacterium]|jgi:hypothetical protein|nr:hypothetical protein [Myxococcales bacterium]